MVQSVELLLDPASESQVTWEWSVLVDAGLPSQARHTGATNRPHITVGVAATIGRRQEAGVASAVEGMLPLAMRLGGALVFGAGPFILCRAVVPTVELLRLQARVVQAIGPGPDSGAHQLPGRWTAHVTLARRLTAVQVGAALTALSPMADLSATAVAARRWDGDRKVDWLIGADDGTDDGGPDGCV